MEPAETVTAPHESPLQAISNAMAQIYKTQFGRGPDKVKTYFAGPDAVVCVGVPFGHTRPQWILPYGGEVTVDGGERRIWADYR